MADETDVRAIVAAVEELADGCGQEYGYRFATPEDAVRWALGADDLKDGSEQYAAYLRLKGSTSPVEDGNG